MMFDSNSLAGLAWEDYSSRTLAEKVQVLWPQGSPYHILFSQQFDRAFLDRTCRLATTVRVLAKSRKGILLLQNILSDKRAMLYFMQPSSRTFLSFPRSVPNAGDQTG